jgi:PAS domain S-box-containing protein
LSILIDIVTSEVYMSRFANLRLGTKFNLIMSLLLLVLFIAAALLTYQRQKQLILKMAVDNARNYARVIIETRDYMSGAVKGEPENNYGLVPQVVATQVAKRITQDSKYYVRQVSLRYRNPDNRPDDFETAQLKIFAQKVTGETSRVITTKGEEVFRYMLPMVAEKSCLGCHGDYDMAPKFVRDRFPRGHYSFNYRLGEVIGAVSVTIPMSDLYRQIGANLELDLAVRGSVFFIIILLMGILIRRTIINPVKLLSETIVHVTKTGSFADSIPQRSNDEIGRLIAAFNEMMVELAHKTQQSRDSEDRYRKFIEMARSAVVTFMEDGKIIISNQRAEELIGLSRQALLGENIFTFLKNGDSLKNGISSYVKTGKGGGVEESSLQQLLSVTGKKTAVEMALTASITDRKPLFTAILRELSPDQ